MTSNCRNALADPGRVGSSFCIAALVLFTGCDPGLGNGDFSTFSIGTGPILPPNGTYEGSVTISEATATASCLSDWIPTSRALSATLTVSSFAHPLVELTVPELGFAHFYSGEFAGDHVSADFRPLWTRSCSVHANCGARGEVELCVQKAHIEGAASNGEIVMSFDDLMHAEGVGRLRLLGTFRGRDVR